MKAPLFGATQSTLSTTATQYTGIRGTFGGGPVTTESAKQTIVPGPMTLSNLYVNVSVAPGASASYTFTVMKNGVATALSVVISGGSATSGNDTTDSVTFAAGDLIDLQIIPSAGTAPTASTKTYWNMLSDSGDANAFSSLLGGNNALASTTLTQYSNISGMSNTYSVTESAQQIVVPTSGTLSNLYVVLDGAAGASANYQITLVKNGSTTALTATVSGASATTASDTSDSISLTAGDTISIQSVPSAGTAPTARRISWGIRWTPTTNGESFFGFGSSNAPSATATNWEQPLNNGAGGWSATESARLIMPGTCVLTAMYISCGTAPGIGTSRILTVRKNSSSSAVTATASGTSTTANITGQNVFIGQTDTVDIQASVSGVPAADIGGIHLGILTYIAPPITSTQPTTSRIQVTGIATSPSKSRIQVVLTSTLNTISRLRITGISTNTTRSRIQSVLTATRNTISRIQTQSTNIITTMSRISITGTNTQSTVSRIQITGTSTRPTKSRIQAVLTATRQTVSRIQTNPSATENTVSRIQKIRSSTLATKSRIQVTGYGTPLGLLVAITNTAINYGHNTIATVSRIQKTPISMRITMSRISITPSLTQPTTSRIQVTGTNAQNTVSRIIAQAIKTIGTVSRISVIGVKTITSKSRISIITTSTQQTRSRIRSVQTSTIGTRSRIMRIPTTSPIFLEMKPETIYLDNNPQVTHL